MSDIPERLATALASRYPVEREVGAGGMATVYLARDLRHKRSVAIKVVRPELGGREGVERFLREIELAARLQHPHILPVFDSGVVESQDAAPVPYFVMPYVEGETLRQRLQREGRLSIEAASAIAGEVSDALAYAHAHGVVHRDIKPENILLTGGHAVVADFGVAKALESGAAPVAISDPTRLTRAGIAVGTPLYMSPEQATADDAVDARSDQYSLSCVLYEMLAGEPPFTGPTQQSVIARSLSAPRPHVTRLRSEVPPPLEEVILRAMALEPAQRYPDMNAFGAALREARSAPDQRRRRRFYLTSAAALLAAAAAGGWLATRPAIHHRVAPAAETLAVLPFRTSGPNVGFLSEGMMDLLATNLKGVGGIRTVDPRAVLREWGQARGADDLARALTVGRELDAGSVVLGSAVSTGGRVRVAADLYGIDGQRLGQAQVDGSADSVLGVVDRLSLALLRDVWRSKEPLPNLRVAALTTDSIQALRAFLEGERYYRRLAWDSALGAYSRAVEADSTFALAHLRRAEVYGWTGGYGSKESHDAVAAAVRFARRLSPRDQRLLVGYQLFDSGKPAAIDSLSAFVGSYPEDVEGWYLLGESLFHIRSFRPVAPDSISGVFDSVLTRDSTLFPALIHPLDLALLYRDSTRFARYFPAFARTAPADRVTALKTGASLIWGPPPAPRSISAALGLAPYWVIESVNSFYRERGGTSDSLLSRVVLVQRAVPPVAQYQAHTLGWKAPMLAGLGRWREASLVVDTLARYDADRAMDVRVWSVVLGVAPADMRKVVDSAVASFPPGGESEYAHAMVDLLRGRVDEGRKRIARTLAARDAPQIPQDIHGLLVAADGFGLLLQGDTTAGISRLRSGLNLAAAPGSQEETAYLRFQLALVLAANPATRDEGIRRLRYGFDFDVLYLPLTELALGHTYEAAGQRDSAVQAYTTFLQLWDQADPEYQGRIKEARAALQELSRERP